MTLEVVGRSSHVYWVADSALPKERTQGMLYVRAWDVVRKRWHDHPPQPLEGIERFTSVRAMTDEERAAALAEILEAGGDA